MRFLLSACALVSAFATPVVANTDSVDLDEIIVTASRRPTGSEDISSALSIISQKDVLQQKLTTDALASKVGVYLQQTTPGQGAAIIRGLKGSAILHLVDGMPLSNAMFRSAPTPYLALVPTTAVKRIEIVRGTPASLYGNQAVGGVIQVVSRVPTFDSDNLETHQEVMVGFDTAEELRSVKGILDFGDQNLAATISGEYLTTGDRRIGGGERLSPSGYTAKAARFAVSGTPSESKSWLVDFHYVEQPSTPRIDELVPGFGQTEPSSSEFFFTPSRRLFAHAQHISNDALFELDWRIDAAWQRVEDDRTTRGFESRERRYESNHSDLYAMSVSAASESSFGSWIVGVDIQSDEISSARIAEDIDTMLFTTRQSRFPDGSRIDQAAVFGNLDWSVSDHHHISGGLRYTDVEIDVPDTLATDVASIGIQRFSGDLGWVFSFSESWQLVANAGFGFRAPNISDLGTLGERPGNRFNIPNTDLGAERVQQFDVGVRRHTENLRFELMIYTLSFENRITSVFTGNVTPDGRDIVQSVNAAKTDVRGAEAGLDFDIADNITMHAVLNYTWGSEMVGTEAAQPGDRIPPLSGKLVLQVDLNAEWSAESWLNFSGNQDRLSDRDIRDTRINPDGTAGWAILGAKATWVPNDIWSIDLIADNLLDKQYRVHGSGIDAVGRNFGITARVSW